MTGSTLSVPGYWLRTRTSCTSRRLTVKEFLDQWMNKHVRATVRPITLDGYRKKLRPHVIPAVGHLQLRHLRPHHLASIYGDMAAKGLACRTILHVHRVVHTVLAKAVAEGLLATNPAGRVPAPKPMATDPKVWDAEQVRTFAAGVVDNPYREFYTLMIFTGLRVSEMLGLKWPAVNLNHRFLSVVQVRMRVNGLGVLENEPKTPRSRRRVSFESQATIEFERIKARQKSQSKTAGESWRDGGYVFTDATGSPLDGQVLARAFKAYVSDIGLPYLTLGKLRHVHATMLLLEGANVKVVSERLGHSSTRVTADVYSHVLPEMERSAATVLDHLLP